VAVLKLLNFLPTPVSTVDVATVLRILKNVRNMQSSKKESHSDTERVLFDFVTILYKRGFHRPSWRLGTRDASILSQRSNQPQPTFLLLLLFLRKNKRAKRKADCD
jgi:hypothetical protein